MSGDTRLWMYRKSEARLFEHPDHVPDEEDWQRFPLPGEGKDEVSGLEGRISSQHKQELDLSKEEKLDRLSRQRLMQVAADCGVRFEISWTKAQLKQAIHEVLHGNRA
jgi:hypothetical protein